MKEMKSINDKFLKVADFVSFGMGTPTNILFWVLAVVIWFILGVTRPGLFTHTQFLPDWFTSTSWNFPLNTITTLAELYIGFLVAAATNRAERELRKVIEEIRGTVEEVKKINSNQDKILSMLVDYQKKELSEDKKIIKDVEQIKK
ncbi:hypothetical protein BH10PAT1_BH10PAT1_4680 [soil metagenome]